MIETYEWEAVVSDFDERDYPSFAWHTQRLRVPGGWIYRHTIMTAVGPNMSMVFVPLPEPPE